MSSVVSELSPQSSFHDQRLHVSAPHTATECLCYETGVWLSMAIEDVECSSLFGQQGIRGEGVLYEWNVDQADG